MLQKGRTPDPKGKGAGKCKKSADWGEGKKRHLRPLIDPWPAALPTSKLPEKKKKKKRGENHCKVNKTLCRS